jgi:hypothetical protein
MSNDQNEKSQLSEVINSAKRLGVELDEKEAEQWLKAIDLAKEKGDEIVFDLRSGVFGQNIAMLDFSPARLDYFRKVGNLVEFKDIPGLVETALALSGSSAQSKIQTYPGDADYFERVNIIAPTKEEACKFLAMIMRKKALDTARGSTFQLIEVKLGSFDQDLVHSNITHKKGSPISWTPEQIKAGKIEGFSPDGKPIEIIWEQAAQDPGWCKLDWIVADPLNGSLANASNMLDVTWEALDGSITPLDGYLDPYFQEVYLQAESVPLFSKLAQHVSADALDDYVKALEGEVKKYLTKSLNYGKAAKRMYNVFRLTGRYHEAAYLRELFDEPATLLYQVWSLIRTVDDALRVKAEFECQKLIDQIDNLIVSVVKIMEDDRESEIVKRLLTFRDAISRQACTEDLNAEAEAARDEVINVVNNFFYDRLNAVPEIKSYIEGFKA